MDERTRRRTRIVMLGVLPPLAVAVITVWAFWLRGDAEPEVFVREHGVTVEHARLSDAASLVQQRTGLRPAVPDSVPVEGLSLIQFDILHPGESNYEEPAVWSWIAEPVPPPEQPQLIWLVQSTEYPPGAPSRVPDGALQLDLRVDGAEGWEFDSPNQQYLVRAGGLYVYVQIFAWESPSTDDVLPMLRSIARQLR